MALFIEYLISLGLIAVDRFLAAVKPFLTLGGKGITRKRAVTMIAISWVLSLFVSSLGWVHQLGVSTHFDSIRLSCYPDLIENNMLWLLCNITLFVAITLIICCYTCLVLRVSQKKRAFEIQRNVSVKNQKGSGVFFTAALILVAHIVTWVPFAMFFGWVKEPSHRGAAVTTWILYGSGCVNPIIYALRGSKLRNVLAGRLRVKRYPTIKCQQLL
ncbi:melanopsin-B-like [Ptychodera flava]|uniref:melanopsin-B-like n=1 Tax=Ptychodera flava TaxID=63121 RepID=UPI00396A4D41